MAAAALKKSAADAAGHLRGVCEFSLNRPPMRAKVDRQSYDELKPGVDRALALLDWFTALQTQFVQFLSELRQLPPGPDDLALIAEAIDVIVVMENQFAGWSACINRFSWFKRTFAQVRREVAKEINADKLQQDISKFQAFIGARAPRLRPPSLARVAVSARRRISAAPLALASRMPRLRSLGPSVPRSPSLVRSRARRAAVGSL